MKMTGPFSPPNFLLCRLMQGIGSDGSGVASLFRRVTQRPVKLPLLLCNGNDGVYFVQNLEIIDDALGVVVYSCVAEHMNGGASSSTQELALK